MGRVEITHRHRQGVEEIHVDFAGRGVKLTADGEVALLGLAHHYLASWVARAAEGAAPPPHTIYTYIPASLTLPVIPVDARAMAQVMRLVLSRPSALESARSVVP